MGTGGCSLADRNGFKAGRSNLGPELFNNGYVKEKMFSGAWCHPHQGNVSYSTDFNAFGLKTLWQKKSQIFSPDLLHWEGIRPSSSEKDQSHAFK